MAGMDFVMIWVAACSCFVRISVAYNFVTSLPTVKKGEPGTHFGFSVSFHARAKEEGGPGILVGAPKDFFQDYPNMSGVAQPGRSYFCDTDQEYFCGTPIDRGQNVEKLGLTVNSSLSGFAVCGSSRIGGSLITCAPHMRSSRNIYMSPGICWKYEKLTYYNNFGFCDPRDHYFDTYGLCNFGFSCAMSSEEAESFAVGAPGVLLWTGGLSRYFVGEDGFAEVEATLKNVMDQGGNQITDKYSYLGYSVAVGKMNGKEIYVSGAPREKYVGYVFLLRYANSSLHLVKKLRGEKFGSYFGASVCLADVNGDGETDLIVGAPLYYEPFVGGAIYVYIKKKNNKLEFEEPQKIKSRPMKEAECLKLNCFDARFGWSISSLTDIDYDGYQDVAVGAPFEGKGVVYIFRGSKDGLIPKYSQRIESKDVDTGTGLPTPFGYSLDSRGVDVDDNGYPDLVVGSFRTDSVHVLRTLSVVVIYASFQNLPSIIDPELQKCPSDGQPKNCFEVRVCLATAPQQHNLKARKASVNLTLEAEVYTGATMSRVYFEGYGQKDGYKVTKIVELNLEHKNVEVCNNYKLYIGNNVKDFLNPIPIRLTYSVLSDIPPFDNNKLLSLLETTTMQGVVSTRELKVDFKKNCGDDNECRSELELTSQLLLEVTGPDRYKLLVGLDKEVVLKVRVQNSEEDAHEASVFVHYPDSFEYLGSSVVKEKDRQVSCSLSPVKDFIVCSVGNPFTTGSIVDFKLRFDPKGVSLAPEPLTIEVLTNTTSKDNNLENNKRTLKIEVTIESDLWITGNSEPESVFFGGEVVGESAMTTETDIGLEVRHSYEVKNIGRAKVPGSTLMISWPYELESHHPSGKHILYLLDRPLLEGSGECYFDPKIIDPLGLKDPSKGYDYNVGSDLLVVKVVPKAQHVVKKRDVGSLDKVLDCDLKTAKCHVFNCSIDELRPGQSVVVRLRARLWNSTFLTEFLKREVTIRSKGQILISNNLMRQTNTDNDEFKVTTYALSDLRDEAQVPLWIIIVSVLAGILFLALLVFLLWKFGFFRRKRMSRISTHKAVLTKEADS